MINMMFKLAQPPSPLCADAICEWPLNGHFPKVTMGLYKVINYHLAEVTLVQDKIGTYYMIISLIEQSNRDDSQTIADVLAQKKKGKEKVRNPQRAKERGLFILTESLQPSLREQLQSLFKWRGA